MVKKLSIQGRLVNGMPSDIWEVKGLEDWLTPRARQLVRQPIRGSVLVYEVPGIPMSGSYPDPDGEEWWVRKVSLGHWIAKEIPDEKSLDKCLVLLANVVNRLVGTRMINYGVMAPLFLTNRMTYPVDEVMGLSKEIIPAHKILCFFVFSDLPVRDLNLVLGCKSDAEAFFAEEGSSCSADWSAAERLEKWVEPDGYQNVFPQIVLHPVVRGACEICRQLGLMEYKDLNEVAQMEEQALEVVLTGKGSPHPLYTQILRDGLFWGGCLYKMPNPIIDLIQPPPSYRVLF